MQVTHPFLCGLSLLSWLVMEKNTTITVFSKEMGKLWSGVFEWTCHFIIRALLNMFTNVLHPWNFISVRIHDPIQSTWNIGWQYQWCQRRLFRGLHSTLYRNVCLIKELWNSFGIISWGEVCIYSEPFVIKFLDKEINSHVLFLIFEHILLPF